MTSSLQFFLEDSPGTTFLICSLVVLLIFVFTVSTRMARERKSTAFEISRLRHFAEQMAESQIGLAKRLAESQADLSGRLQQSHSSVNDRLDLLHQRLGDGLTKQTEKTGANLKELEKRLVIIDRAQQTITGLSEQMVSLQDILYNKQMRKGRSCDLVQAGPSHPM